MVVSAWERFKIRVVGAPTSQPVRCWLFHRWGKWQQQESRYYRVIAGQKWPGVEVRQRRVCLRCNRMQDDLLA